jgi:hypothetical protein
MSTVAQAPQYLRRERCACSASDQPRTSRSRRRGKHQGAAATIVLVVAAQVVTGLVLDAMGLTGAARPIGAQTRLGAALLVCGAVLVVR